MYGKSDYPYYYPSDFEEKDVCSERNFSLNVVNADINIKKPYGDYN
ncbi:hypothetical protein IKI14_06055 [bacterium]|nr:hypothetical protein [bacterium]